MIAIKRIATVLWNLRIIDAKFLEKHSGSHYHWDDEKIDKFLVRLGLS